MDKEHEYLIFELNEEKEEFQELIILEGIELSELLLSEGILAVIDKGKRIIWNWIGKESNIKARFVSSIQIKILRDKYAFGYKIISIDENDEPSSFKQLFGLEIKEEKKTEEKIEPLYLEERVDEFDKQMIVLLLEKINLPEGYKRELIIVKDIIYLYREIETITRGTNLLEHNLYSLQEKIDGSFLLNGFTPRLIFSYGKLLLIEMLKKESE